MTPPSFTFQEEDKSIIEFRNPDVPWYWRLWFVVKIPYDIARWIVTGYLYFGWKYNRFGREGK